MNYQEMSVRVLIGVKREIQERLREAATVAEKALAQKDLDELDTVLKAKVENRFWSTQNR